MPAHASASFFDAWDTYQKVVTCDYMFHREIGEALNQLLRAHFGGRPFSILDLGCGDAATLTPLLEGWRSSYTRRGLVGNRLGSGRGESENPSLPGATHPGAYLGDAGRGRHLRRDLQQFRPAPFATAQKANFSTWRRKG